MTSLNSHATEAFWKAYRSLPVGVQERARDAYRLWRTNPGHPGLHFKPIHSGKQVYSVRVGLGYRALGVRDGETMVWFWIGSHADYDRLIGRL